MVSSIYYNGDGSTRIFPVSFKILGDDYIRVYVDDVEVVDKTKYDIINNSVVFTTSETPAIGVDNVKIFVATSSSELGDLGAPLFDITSVANNLQEIIDVSESLSTIASVNDNEANINLVGANTANIDTVANGISNVNTVAEWVDGGFPIVETGNAFVVETVEELSSIPAGYKVAIVSDLDRGGTFEWSATGTANGGTVFAGVSGYWHRQYSGAVNVKWFGVNATNVQSAINYVRSSGGVLFGEGNFIFDMTVDFRYVMVDFSNTAIDISHAGVGIIIGGNASNGNNPTQRFNQITRSVGIDNRITPTVRGIGVKGQNIHIERTSYFQLYALDGDPVVKPLDYSCAYSNLYLKYAHTVELYGASLNGWINENQFYLNRTNNIIIFSEGGYIHNHNKFINGTMENKGVINVEHGSSNSFEGLRFERNLSDVSQTLDITFGESTWNNNIQVSWSSSPGYANSPYGTINGLVNISDNGSNNSVVHKQEEQSDDIILLSLDSNTNYVSSINKNIGALVRYNTDVKGLRNIKHLTDTRFRIYSSFFTIFKSSTLIPVEKGNYFVLESDSALFRIGIQCYDKNKNVIDTQPLDSITGVTWNDTTKKFNMAANVARHFINITDSSIVKYVEISVESGNSTADKVFNYCYLSFRASKHIDTHVREALAWREKDSRFPSLYYQNSADINMSEIGQGIPCYLSNMSEMKINLYREISEIKSIEGNVVTLYEELQISDASNAKLIYTDSSNNLVSLDLTSGYNNSVTLANTPPVDLNVNDKVHIILPKTKLL